MKFIKLFEIDDMRYEIVSYLSFEDKVILGKIVKKCFTKYNFNSKQFQCKTLDSINKLCKPEDDDEFCDYMTELCSNFTSELDTAYTNYCGYDDEDISNDYYNNISYQCYRDLQEMFYDSYMVVYLRKVIEHIENNNLCISYENNDLFELDELVELNIHETVLEYYKNVLEHGNIDIFCNRCGLFGHESSCKKCILYNNTNANMVIKQTVKTRTTHIIDNIIENHYTEEKRIAREQLLCYLCKKNNKKTKCENSCCKYCCSGCKIHKTNIK
jgi:hypothetical protein